MPYLNVKERVLEAKVVYYGAGLSGKTTNLEQIKAGAASDGRVGEMMSLNTDGDRTLFFDYLPFEIGKLNGLDVKVQLYTVPGQTKYAETRRRVLAGADGVVLVLDSQAGALERNRQTVNDLQEHMRANNLDPAATPILVQLNKRDLPTAMDADALRRECGVDHLPYTEAVACDGKGVFETLRTACRMVLEAIKGSAREGRTQNVAAGQGSGLDGRRMHDELRRHVGEDGMPLPAPSAPRPSAAMPAAAAAAPARPAAAAAAAPSFPVASAPAPSVGSGMPMAAASAPAAPGVAPARPTGQNGYAGPNGTANGSTAPRPPAQGLEAVFRSLRDEIAKMNAKSDAAAAALASGGGASGGPKADALVDAQRQLAQRLETLERNVGGYLQQSVQRLEQRLQDVARSGAGGTGGDAGGAGLEAAKQIATKLAGATDALSGKVDGLGQHVGTLQGDLASVKQRGDALAKGLAEVGRVLAKMNETVTQLESRAGTPAGSATGAGPSTGALEARIAELESSLSEKLATLEAKTVTSSEVDELVTSVSSMVIGELRAQDEAFTERLRRDREEARANADTGSAGALAAEALDERLQDLEGKLDAFSTKLDAMSGHTAERVSESLAEVRTQLADDLDRFGHEQRENFAKLETALNGKLDATHDEVAQLAERLERHAGAVEDRFEQLAERNRAHAQAVETWFGQVLQAANVTVDELRRGKGKWWKNT